MNEKKSVRILIGLSLPLAVGLVVAWTALVKRPLPCLIRALTGLYCPACGATRAVMALLGGDLYSALRNNLIVTIFAVPMFAAACAVYFCALSGRLSEISDRTLIYSAVAICAFGVFFFAFGAVRNISAYPFTLLAPII